MTKEDKQTLSGIVIGGTLLSLVVYDVLKGVLVALLPMMK